MFNLGDRVKHLDTGNIGIVIGYGKQIVNNKCLDTIKVRLIGLTSKKRTTIKDIYCQWLSCPEDYQILLPNPTGKHLIPQSMKRYELAKSA